MQSQDRPRSGKYRQHQERRDRGNFRVPRMRRSKSHLRTDIGFTAYQSPRSINWKACRVIKRLLPAVIAVAALASTAYTLTLLDQVVHGTLYSYGLQFNYGWANPYWTLLRVTLALLAISAAATVFNTILILRLGVEKKQPSIKIAPTQKIMKSVPVTTQVKERAPIASYGSSPQPSPKPTIEPTPERTPEPTSEPTPIMAPVTSYKAPDLQGLFKCVHCGKMFTQPLRMLDFQGDPPRIVNVCPFCNETMPSESSIKESEHAENKKPFFKKNNNHVQKPLAH